LRIAVLTFFSLCLWGSYINVSKKVDVVMLQTNF
jgi:hypothetical protein